jgi:hypothetical protein
MKELLQILGVMAGIAVSAWLLLNASASFGLWCQQKFGFWPRYSRSRRPAKTEIQTLFHGNTKDEDQI